METDPSESLVWLDCLDLLCPDTDDRTVELWLVFLKKPSCSPAGGECWEILWLAALLIVLLTVVGLDREEATDFVLERGGRGREEQSELLSTEVL